MSKVFVLSTPITAKTFSYNIDYLLNFKVVEIILLSENHMKTDKICYNKNIKITIYDKIEECIEYSDIVIVFENKYIPVHSLETVKRLVELFSKRLYILKDFLDYEFSSEIQCLKEVDIDRLSAYPIIFHAAIGNVSQSLCTEITLNKIFNAEVVFEQFFSNSTLDLLEQLQKNGLLNQCINYTTSNSWDSVELVILSINIQNDINELTHYNELLKRLNADYFILQVEKNFFDYEKARNIVAYSCFSKLDAIVKSNYTYSDNKFKLYLGNKNISSKDCYNIETKDFDLLLYNSIKDKLSLPPNVIRM